MNKKEDLDKLVEKSKEFGPETQFLCEMLSQEILFISSRFKTCFGKLDEILSRLNEMEDYIRKMQDPIWKIESEENNILK